MMLPFIRLIEKPTPIHFGNQRILVNDAIIDIVYIFSRIVWLIIMLVIFVIQIPQFIIAQVP